MGMEGLTQGEQLTLIYRSDKDEDNKIRSFIESLPGYVVRVIDLVRETLSEKQLEELAYKMKTHVEDLIDPSNDDRISVHHGGQKVLNRKDMLSLMARDPKILKTPFVVIGNQASKFASAYKLFRKG
jgi:arsenate reductase-like glutaredoxin family protein